MHRRWMHLGQVTLSEFFSRSLILYSADYPPASSHRLKSSRKPDVVSNSVIDETSASEITRLETLCEEKTRQLTRLRHELGNRLRMLEAMAIVVNYFVAQVGLILFNTTYMSCMLTAICYASAKSWLISCTNRLCSFTNHDATLAFLLTSLILHRLWSHFIGYRSNTISTLK